MPLLIIILLLPLLGALPFVGVFAIFYLYTIRLSFKYDFKFASESTIEFLVPKEESPNTLSINIPYKNSFRESFSDLAGEIKSLSEKNKKINVIIPPYYLPLFISYFHYHLPNCYLYSFPYTRGFFYNFLGNSAINPIISPLPGEFSPYGNPENIPMIFVSSYNDWDLKKSYNAFLDTLSVIAGYSLFYFLFPLLLILLFSILAIIFGLLAYPIFS